MNKFSITVTTRFTRGAERRLLEIFFFFLVEVLLKGGWKNEQDWTVVKVLGIVGTRLD
jgi:hypothetical protein